MVNIEEQREGNVSIVTFSTDANGPPSLDNEVYARLFFKAAGWLKNQTNCIVSAVTLQNIERWTETQLSLQLIVRHREDDGFRVMAAEGS